MPKTISQQTFSYDALSNITSCITMFVGGGQNTATYTYARSSGKDPCQLQSVSHTHADYPKPITLTYDAAGRLEADEHGRALIYDACGRLASIAAGASYSAASYQYDPFDQLAAQTIDADTTSLYYRASRLVNQLTGTDTSQHQRFIGGIAQSTNETIPKTWLTGSDSQRNVLLAEQGGERETQTYSPYGYHQPESKAHSKLGHTGERRDPASGVYHLGNGYRSYNPVLMRFTAPDSWSPFGAGGINPYAYCAGDPINQADPSGHMSLGGWIGLGLGIVGGIAVGILTEGAALPAVASLIATVVADATVGVATQMTAMAIDRERLDSLGAGGWGAIIGLSVAGTLGGWGTAWVGRAVSQARAAAASETTMTLGQNSLVNIGLARSGGVGQLAALFTDEYAGGQRLTVIGHARTTFRDKIQLDIGAKSYTANTLVDQLREQGLNFGEFTSARILVCNSAKRIRQSFAAQFAKKSGLPTTGYEGLVSIEGPLVKLMKDAVAGTISSDDLMNAMNTALNQMKTEGGEPLFRVLKEGRLSNGRKVNYDPKTFVRMPGNANNVLHFPSGYKKAYADITSALANS